MLDFWLFVVHRISQDSLNRQLIPERFAQCPSPPTRLFSSAPVWPRLSTCATRWRCWRAVFPGRRSKRHWHLISRVGAVPVVFWNTTISSALRSRARAPVGAPRGGGLAAAGRPRLPLRLMASLLYLKHVYKLSDEELVERWAENVQWQFFSGMT